MSMSSVSTDSPDATAAPLADANLAAATWQPILVAALVTAGSLGLAGLVESRVLGALALFYGPLVAAVLAQRNAVGRAALGGWLGTAVSFALLVVIRKHTAAKGTALLTHVTSTGGVIVVGFAAIALYALPAMLTGAAVGEALARGRRDRAAAVAALGNQQRALSDDELAKIEL